MPDASGQILITYDLSLMGLNEPPKTFSQTPLVVSLKVRNFVARYKCSAKVICLQIINKSFDKKIICMQII